MNSIRKGFKIFLKKINNFKLKNKEVNHKFLQIQFKLKWIRIKNYKNNQRNIQEFLLLNLMKKLLTGIQKVQAANKKEK